MSAKPFLIPLLALGLAGCTVEAVHTGETHRDSCSIPRDASEFLSVNLQMGAGDLHVSGGGNGFLDGTLIYNVESWKPEVRYSTAAGHGNLSISQPGARRGSLGHTRYEWDLRLADDVPVDLTVHFGAGEASLNLGKVALRSVDLNMGVGKLEMDLRGKPTRDSEVRVRGGIGEVTVRLPRDAGIYARAEGGIGSIQTRGLRKEGAHWVNDAYDRATHTIRVNVKGGIGQINLIAD